MIIITKKEVSSFAFIKFIKWVIIIIIIMIFYFKFK